MRELVRLVHVGCLAYVLPDRAKKCCLTWRQAVEHHLGTTGKRPTWSEHSFECKICHRFSRSEKEFESHYATRHSDSSVYEQCLRRLGQWNTRDVPETEVEYNVDLIYTVGQALEMDTKVIERNILAASGLSDQQKPVPVGSGSTNRPREPPKRTKDGDGMAPETPTTLTPRLASLLERGRAAMGTIQKPTDKDDPKPIQDAKKDNQKPKKDAGGEKKKKRRQQLSMSILKVTVVKMRSTRTTRNPQSHLTKNRRRIHPPLQRRRKRWMCTGGRKEPLNSKKLLHKVTRENKSLKRQLSSERAKKSRKSRSWKKAVKSVLEAGSGSTNEGGEKK